MPRNMSFMLTTKQIQDRSKTVTRRLGWKMLKVGDIVNACVKCQGIPPGEKIQKLCQIRIVNLRREALNRMHGKYGRDEARKEGFPELRGFQFVNMFCEHMDCRPTQEVTRIEFEYVEAKL